MDNVLLIKQFALVVLTVVIAVIVVSWCLYSHLRFHIACQMARWAERKGDQHDALQHFVVAEKYCGGHLAVAHFTLKNYAKQLQKTRRLFRQISHCAAELGKTVDTSHLDEMIQEQIDFLRNKDNHSFGSFGTALRRTAEGEFSRLASKFEAHRETFRRICSTALE